jgi:predicted nuclease of predicted toxin-antitoxin system
VSLLIDQNLSPRLVRALAGLYPDLVHVRDVGLAAADDRAVWAYAAQHGLTIVSKDSDFSHSPLSLAPPPKAIWIRRGNCSTAEIEAMLRRHHDDVRRF